MKVGSNVKPSKQFNIEERENGKVAVIFFANIEESEKDDKKYYNYDMYVIETQNQDNLEERITNNFDLWFDFAKNQEITNKEKEVRKTRDELLTETDWTQVVDSALSEEQKEAYRIYRQALRDITDQPGFPYEINWPTKP